jgi:hypothetical protein
MNLKAEDDLEEPIALCVTQLRSTGSFPSCILHSVKVVLAHSYKANCLGQDNDSAIHALVIATFRGEGHALGPLSLESATHPLKMCGSAPTEMPIPPT